MNFACATTWRTTSNSFILSCILCEFATGTLCNFSPVLGLTVSIFKSPASQVARTSTSTFACLKSIFSPLVLTLLVSIISLNFENMFLFSALFSLSRPVQIFSKAFLIITGSIFSESFFSLLEIETGSIVELLSSSISIVGIFTTFFKSCSLSKPLSSKLLISS